MSAIRKRGHLTRLLAKLRVGPKHCPIEGVAETTVRMPSSCGVRTGLAKRDRTIRLPAKSLLLPIPGKRIASVMSGSTGDAGRNIGVIVGINESSRLDGDSGNGGPPATVWVLEGLMAATSLNPKCGIYVVLKNLAAILTANTSGRYTIEARSSWRAATADRRRPSCTPK